MTYKCEYEDGEMEVLTGTDGDIFSQAIQYEAEHGCLFNIFEVDENYDVIRNIF